MIRDYELYRKTILSTADDLKIIIKCHELLNSSFTNKLKERAKERIRLEKYRVKEIAGAKTKQGIYVRLLYKDVLDEIAKEEQRYKNEIIDELIKNYYVENYKNKNVIFKIKDELNIIKLIMEDIIGQRDYDEIKRKYFANKFRGGRNKYYKQNDKRLKQDGDTW